MMVLVVNGTPPATRLGLGPEPRTKLRRHWKSASLPTKAVGLGSVSELRFSGRIRDESHIPRASKSP